LKVGHEQANSMANYATAIETNLLYNNDTEFVIKTLMPATFQHW